MVLWWLKKPVSVPPSEILLSLTVTGEIKLQTLPLSVTGLPPSEVIWPPRMADPEEIEVAVGQQTEGASKMAEVA